MLIEANGTIVYINEIFTNLLRYRSPYDLIGRTIADIATEGDADRLLWFTQCRESGKPAPARYTYKARCRDRSIVTLDASVSASRTAWHLLITTFVRPVTEGCEPAVDVPGLKRLSPREMEIFTRLIRAQRPKQIAFTLDISVKTVASHRQRIYRKLALRNSLDLFRFAAQNGMLER